MKVEGLILKGIGGFYYVKTADGVFECKAKGKFRKQKISPIAGDRVIISVNSGAENTIDEIAPRKNALVRPPVANVDLLFIVVSTCEPFPNTAVIDKMTVIAEKNNIEPVIILTKSDLKSAEEICEIYKKTPYRIIDASKGCEESALEEIKGLICGRLCVFCGNSGVGKSSLINRLCPSLSLATASISDKLGRGRHTTRQAEIFEIADGFAVDTAGFSAIDFLSTGAIRKGDLQYCFPEFDDYIGQCKFVGCAHVHDKGCAVCRAVENGFISKSRHESYIALYNEAKNIKEWEIQDK